MSFFPTLEVLIFLLTQCRISVWKELPSWCTTAAWNICLLCFLLSRNPGFLSEPLPTSPFTKGCVTWKSYRNKLFNIRVVNIFSRLFSHLICLMIIFMQKIKIYAAGFINLLWLLGFVWKLEKSLYKNATMTVSSILWMFIIFKILILWKWSRYNIYNMELSSRSHSNITKSFIPSVTWVRLLEMVRIYFGFFYGLSSLFLGTYRFIYTPLECF